MGHIRQDAARRSRSTSHSTPQRTNACLNRPGVWLATARLPRTSEPSHRGIWNGGLINGNLMTAMATLQDQTSSSAGAKARPSPAMTLSRRYLSDPADLSTFDSGATSHSGRCSAPSLRRCRSSIITLRMPGCRSGKFSSSMGFRAETDASITRIQIANRYSASAI